MAAFLEAVKNNGKNADVETVWVPLDYHNNKMKVGNFNQFQLNHDPKT